MLTDVTKKDCYPLPLVEDTLDTMSGAQWFSTLDLKCRYYQVGLHQENKEKSSFSTTSCLIQINVMPLGLCNAPAKFVRLMYLVLRGLTWKTFLAFRRCHRHWEDFQSPFGKP